MSQRILRYWCSRCGEAFDELVKVQDLEKALYQINRGHCAKCGGWWLVNWTLGEESERPII